MTYSVILSASGATSASDKGVPLSDWQSFCSHHPTPHTLAIMLPQLKEGAFRTKFYESIAGKSAANETGQPGDPHRAGEIIAGIIERPDCPGRLLLGSDAVKIITGEFESRLDEIRKWSDLSRKTDYKEEL